MRADLSAPALAALASGNVVIVALLKLAFPSGTVALNTSTWDMTVDGTLYRGAYGIGSVTQLRDSPGDIKGLMLTLDAGDVSRLALALDAADEVQGTPFTMGTLILDGTSYAKLDAVTDWTGQLDTMAISEDGASATVQVSVESAGVDLLRGNPATYSDADQQAIAAGDRAFEYVVDQVDKPVIWPAREFFFK